MKLQNYLVTNITNICGEKRSFSIKREVYITKTVSEDLYASCDGGSLLRRRSLGSSRNLSPPRTSAETSGYISYPLFKKISRRARGDHQTIGGRLLFNRNPQRVINYPSFLITYGKQIPNPCFMYGRNFEKNRRKQLFSMQFSVNPSGENKRVQWISHT